MPCWSGVVGRCAVAGWVRGSWPSYHLGLQGTAVLEATDRFGAIVPSIENVTCLSRLSLVDQAAKIGWPRGDDKALESTSQTTDHHRTRRGEASTAMADMV